MHGLAYRSREKKKKKRNEKKKTRLTRCGRANPLGIYLNERMFGDFMGLAIKSVNNRRWLS